MMPNAGLQEWMKLPEEERASQEKQMKEEWDAWAAKHAGALKETAGAGKTQRVTKEGVANVANDVMMYSMVEAESAEAASLIFKDHPHFGIPDAWIDIMPANVLPGMEK